MDLLEYLRGNTERVAADVHVELSPDRLNNGGMFKIAEFPLEWKTGCCVRDQADPVACHVDRAANSARARFAKAVTTAVTLAAVAGVQRTLRFSLDEVDGRQYVVAEILLDTRCTDTDLSRGEPETSVCVGGDRVPCETPDTQGLLEQEFEVVRALVDTYGTWSNERGFAVRLSQALPRGAVPLEEADVTNWVELLEAGTPAKALAQAQRQFQRLSAEFSLEQTDRAHEHGLDAASATYELLSRVVSETTNTVAVINRDGCVDWVNQAFESLTGYSAEEAIGMSFETFLFGTDSDPEWVARLRRMMTDGKSVSGERMHCRRDGSQYWCAFNISPLHEPDGNVAGWVDIGWDTTSAREAREELERAKQNAEAASRAKGDFLANMSHEIRTPMNVILGMTELALGTELTGQQAEYLNAAKDSAHSLLEILNDILDLSKIEAQRLELEEVDFNLTDVLQKTLRPLVLQAHKRGIELSWKLPDDVPRDLRGDPTRLRQVLLNLISNAIKFTAEGEVVVSVEKQWSSGGEVGLQLSVRDTGIGIPPDRLSRIFEAFTQVDSSTTRQFGGTGLGLAITTELLRLMNGRIWVDSTVGEGSTFFCTLRMREAEGPVPSQPAYVSRTLIGHVAQRLNILIADDHYPNRQLIAEILRKRGHTFREAGSGREVLKCLQQGKFDLVLMDVQMPEMDGFETTDAIRAAERVTRTHRPIVAVTAYSMKGDREKCLAAGMDAYLSKPIDAQELIRLVETLAAATPDSEVTPLPIGRLVLGKPQQTYEASEGQPPSSDFDAALERLGGDVNLLKRQMSFFLDESPKLIEQLTASIAAADAPKVKLAAHRLQGLVSSYDHHRAAHVAQQLEHCASDSDSDEASALAASLSQYVAQLAVAIRSYHAQ